MLNTPSGENMGNPGYLNQPSFLDVVKVDTGYYVFICNLNANTIIRGWFSDLSSAPVMDTLIYNSTVLPNRLEGIQVINDNGQWYGFAVGGQGSNSRLVRLTFDASFKTITKAENLGTFGMNFPQDLSLTNVNGTWIGFTVNYSGDNITRLIFSNGLGAAPTYSAILNNGELDQPWGHSKPVLYNGKWYMFVTCNNSSKICRLSFSDLTSTPKIDWISDPGGSLTSPLDISIRTDCQKNYGLVANYLNNTLVQLNFTGDLSGSVTFDNLGNIGNLNHPQGISDIIRNDNDIFVFIANNNDNTLSRIHYTPCNEPSILTSTLQNPDELYYTNPGIYNINLITHENSLTKNCYCQPVKVEEKPIVALPNDTTLCANESIVLKTTKKLSGYLWNTNAVSDSIIADTSGLYWVEVYNSLGCSDRDTFILSHYTDNLWLGNDTIFTLGESITLNAGAGYSEYYWSTTENTSSVTVYQPGSYWVTVKEIVAGSNYCIYQDTINITLNPIVPNFFTPNGDGYNDKWSPKLFYHYPEAEISIYDRFGKEVARFTGKDDGWDGTSNNKAVQPDTYWYIIDLKNGSKLIKGSLTIKTR